MDRSRYFDNASTTPIDPRVVEAMMPWLTEGYGNAHSLHQLGSQARDAVEDAREQVADLVNAEDPEEIVFTSGATESNNWLVNLCHEGGLRLAYSPFEHSSLLAPAVHRGFDPLANQGWTLEAAEADVYSVIRLNNETGAILDLPGPARLVHSDMTQSIGKLDLPATVFDFASFSSHKIHGPKGVGAFYIRGGLVEPFMLGGDQEQGRRSGTLNVAAIVGFGTACEIAQQSMEETKAHVVALKQALREEIDSLDGMRLNDHTSNSPFIQSVSFNDIEAAPLLIDLDAKGFAVSSGSACSSGSTEPSHVLLALGLSVEEIRGTIRISFSKYNTLESTVAVGREIVESVSRLRRLGRSA